MTTKKTSHKKRNKNIATESKKSNNKNHNQQPQLWKEEYEFTQQGQQPIHYQKKKAIIKICENYLTSII